MSGFDGILGTQLRMLTDALRRQQEARCREILAAAGKKSDEAIRQARRELGERQRQAVDEERQRRRHELLVAGSRIESAARNRAFARYEAILEKSWPMLLDALAARWADAGSRREWCDMVIHEVAGTLSPGRWIIEHSPAWPESERSSFAKRLEERGVPVPEFRPDESVPAGLRIRAGSACVDGTPAGLLARRGEIEALLLACWEMQQSGDEAHG